MYSSQDRGTESSHWPNGSRYGTVLPVPVESDNYLFSPLPPSRLSLSLSLSLTKGYSLSHRLQGTVNQTTGSPTNHKAAAGWCNHSHTDTGWHTRASMHARTHARTNARTHAHWEPYIVQETHRRTVMQALCFSFFSEHEERGFIWEGCGAVCNSSRRRRRRRNEKRKTD